MRTRKIRGPDGEEHNAAEIGFQSVREHWNEYLLDDGSVIRLKPVATEVLRIEGVWDSQGNPVYVLNSTNVLVVSAPDHLKRGEGGAS